MLTAKALPKIYHSLLLTSNRLLILLIHRIKAVRNNFYKHNINCNGEFILWKFVEQFYKIDQNNEMRLAPKLTDSHIAPNNFEKMKVRYATQILSATVAAGLQIDSISFYSKRCSCHS